MARLVYFGSVKQKVRKCRKCYYNSHTKNKRKCAFDSQFPKVMPRVEEGVPKECPLPEYNRDNIMELKRLFSGLGKRRVK